MFCPSFLESHFLQDKSHGELAALALLMASPFMAFAGWGGPTVSNEVCGQGSFVRVTENNLWLKKQWISVAHWEILATLKKESVAIAVCFYSDDPGKQLRWVFFECVCFHSCVPHSHPQCGTLLGSSSRSWAHRFTQISYFSGKLYTYTNRPSSNIF